MQEMPRQSKTCLKMTYLGMLQVVWSVIGNCNRKRRSEKDCTRKRLSGKDCTGKRLSEKACTRKRHSEKECTRKRLSEKDCTILHFFWSVIFMNNLHSIVVKDWCPAIDGCPSPQDWCPAIGGCPSPQDYCPSELVYSYKHNNRMKVIQECLAREEACMRPRSSLTLAIVHLALESLTRLENPGNRLS